MTNPVFITARFRTGSTLLWNIFRNVPNTVSFWEPLHEKLPSLIGRNAAPQQRHYHVDSYFREYPPVEELTRYYRPDFALHRLFLDEHEEHPQLEAYIRYLISCAGGYRSAVLQFNRIDFRLPWMRKSFPGIPLLHLFRKPRDQWISTIEYHRDIIDTDADVDPYRICTWSRDLCRQFPFLAGTFIKHAYQRFYYLWKLSYLAGSRLSDFSISYEDILQSPKTSIEMILKAANLYTEEAVVPCTSIVVSRPVEIWRDYRPEEWFAEMESECELLLTALDLNNSFGHKPLDEIIANNTQYQELLSDRRIWGWATLCSQLAIVRAELVADEKQEVIIGLSDDIEKKGCLIDDIKTHWRDCEADRAARLAIIDELKTVCDMRLEEIRQYRLFIENTTWNRLKRQVASRVAAGLGVLHQHEPVPLSIPRRYYASRVQNGLPSVSIVTPSFNHAAFIERTIQSILDQRYPNLEYFVQDGGSTDGTVEILQRYESASVRWESSKDAGQTNAINLGFRHVTGDIMAYLNSDDLLLPGSLQYIASYFAKHPDVDVVYGHRILIDENDMEIGRWVLPPHDDRILSWADYVPQETLFWRRRLWDRIGGHLDESFRFAMDWDLLIRFRDAGARFVRLPRFLGAFRVHAAQKTVAQIATVGDKEMARLRQRCHGRMVSDLEIQQHTKWYIYRHMLLNVLYKLGIVRY